MSRLEETQKAIIKINKTFENGVPGEIISTVTEAAKLEIMMDAAESLAVIADALREINAREGLKNI